MDFELLKIRLVSFGYSALALVLAAVVSAIASEDMSALITENFGSGVAGTLVLLVLQEVVKHLRNLRVVGKVGAAKGGTFLI